jgi:UDP-N-acetylglucosamine diphosphorylase / glucose-1-phosphate thymidylyltransferase / UDP-N-acetylgalactosamine diphosphorylase / glucosamine-1-phosphate N-acetyltransferase / galactosamine-1-phosphate N-acetyltransferase
VDSSDLSEARVPHPLDPGAPPTEDLVVFQSSRAALRPRAPDLPVGETVTLLLGREVVGWAVPAGKPPPSLELLASPKAMPGSATVEVEGELLENVWDLMDRNARQLRDDIPRHFPGYAEEKVPGSHILGDGLLSLGSNVTVEPGCVFDVSQGPIRLSDGAVVRAHTRLAGPTFVGPGSVVLGGVLSGVTVGPVCKIRGEVESTVILGYSNKAHDGFLGHAYLGRWVNLGAFTTNSDLKNNYGPVRVGTANGAVDTGLLKVGCFLGDHVKTGIGTVINTGTTVGAGSNLFGGRMPPSYVPAFSWGAGTDLTEYRLEPFLQVAARSMARRGMELDEGTAAVLSRAWESTRHLRSAGG